MPGVAQDCSENSILSACWKSEPRSQKKCEPHRGFVFAIHHFLRTLIVNLNEFHEDFEDHIEGGARRSMLEETSEGRSRRMILNRIEPEKDLEGGF